ncbi:MAG TPA: hypothetical protein VEY30_08135, partial [Myxococcaceae bacterium]|nr:hypothetical protein [Myxococcaceae bacterium]
RWMNLPTSGSKIQAAHTAGKGAVSVRGSDTLLDGYGFDFERRLVDASSGRACAATSVACRWKTLFYDMTLPAFVVDVEGAPPDDTDPCEDDRVSVGMTVESVYSDVTVTGAIK